MSEENIDMVSVAYGLWRREGRAEVGDVVALRSQASPLLTVTRLWDGGGVQFAYFDHKGRLVERGLPAEALVIEVERSRAYATSYSQPNSSR